MLKPMVTALALGMLFFAYPLASKAQDSTLAHKTYDEDESKAVILAYHRINEPAHPETSLDFEQFQNHIQIIKDENYNVLPLSNIVAALRNKKNLPTKTIAITFEGGYHSITQQAIPLLIENDLPFTVFFSTGATSIPNYLSWKDLKRIEKYKHADFGLLPSNYGHITHLPKTEQTRLINKARIEFKDHMNREAAFFSYPFGEISNQLEEIIKTQGFEAALGLASGPAHSGSDILALPRFSMTDGYGTPDRFTMITNTYPIPVKDIEPDDLYVTTNIKQIGFTTKIPDHNETNAPDYSQLSCHISGQDSPQIEQLGNRIEILLNAPITGERTRLNCTLPVHSENEFEKQNWRWFGLLFHGPQTTAP